MALDGFTTPGALRRAREALIGAGRPPDAAADPIRRRILRGTAAMVGLVLLGAGLLVDADLRRTAEQGEVAANTAATFARQVERALAPTLLTIAAAEAELSSGAPDGEETRARLRSLLARAVSDHHLTISYGVMDPQGRVIATSTGRVPPGTSVAGRPAFEAPLLAPPGEMGVSPPFTGAFGASQGRPLFGLGRRLLDEAGQTKAVTVANISIPYLADLLSVIEVLGQGRAELFALDGTMLARSMGKGEVFTMPDGVVVPPHGSGSWVGLPPRGRVQTPRGADGAPALMTWQRVEGVPILVRVTMPRAALWLGMSRSGVSALAFALGLCTVMLLAARLVLVEVAKRNTLEAASAARLAVLAKLAADLQDVIQVREALALLVEAVQCLFPTGEVLAVFMPEDGAEEVVHSRRPGAPRPTSDDDPARPVWLSMPLRGDAGEYVGAIEVFGCDARSVAQEDHAALLQVAALGEATLRRARLLMHLSATTADAEAARAQLEQICDTIHDGFCALDRAGLFIYANSAAIRLLDPAGQPLAGRKLPEVLPGEAAPLAAALGGNRVHQGEVVLPGGQVAMLRLVPTGKGFALFLRDMTMAREVERLRETTERLEALGVLTGGVAHDFNNLLTVVIGNAEMLVDSLNERPELAHSAGLILGAAERGAALIRRMMAFARRQPLSPAPTNVATLIEELVPLLRQSVGERVRLVLRLAPGLPYALVDPAQLEAALLNLAINARDAMPRGGTLRIELSEEALGAESLSDFHEAQPGRFLRLAVTDDGQGMAPEVAQRAFEPFFTTKSPGAGSGLGLASVYGFIRQSRGRIQLDSAPGRGTTVVLHLPHAPASVSPAPALAVSGGATEAEAAPGPDAAQARPSGTLHILLVEDEEALRLQIAAMLREMGHTVTVAAQGEAALAQLRQGLRPDVLLSDVVLPGGIDGAAVMREAQAILPELHVILMSGFAARLYDASGALPKGLRLLEKPFRRQALARRLEAVMEGRRKLPAPVQALS